MQRRNFLQLLAALPFVGWMVPKPKTDPRPHKMYMKCPPIDRIEYVADVDMAAGESVQCVTIQMLNELGEYEIVYSGPVSGSLDLALHQPGDYSYILR